MARPKNDQTKLIEALKNGNTLQAWECVKYIGYKEIPDIKERFLMFNKASEKFDPYKNNNFIMFYKSYLKYGAMTNADNEQYLLTSNRAVINVLKRQACSPQENLPALIEEITEFVG